ncbi:MAG: imidazole glycerol phosphate synthase subunit HisH [Gammaproteobacteria bacterium]|nr:imidazole glycerol phosphate synthase subunit HisH [Gammaproteobacteria bacterium]
MKPQVTIVDYGIGNLYSVGRAFEVCGADVIFASNPQEVASARHLVLPGVGAFESGMAGLRERDLVEPIRAHAAEGKPLMGICLGMQMLATVSEEFGEHKGLDLIPGRVCALPHTTVEGESQKVPHIGWAGLYKTPGAKWHETSLADVQEGDGVYLVHSFAVNTDNPEHQLAFSHFGGHPVCTVVRRGALIGCQFHPEKSGPVGLKVISAFLTR